MLNCELKHYSLHLTSGRGVCKQAVHQTSNLMEMRSGSSGSVGVMSMLSKAELIHLSEMYLLSHFLSCQHYLQWLFTQRAASRGNLCWTSSGRSDDHHSRGDVWFFFLWFWKFFGLNDRKKTWAANIIEMLSALHFFLFFTIYYLFSSIFILLIFVLLIEMIQYQQITKWPSTDIWNDL